MKQRNRELNIFSMSALDLFASALGAFILLTVIALPYFTNTHRLDDETLLAQIAEVREQLRAEAEARARAEAALAESEASRQQTEEALASCEQGLEEASEARQQAEEELNQCLRSAQANFLLVLMSWGTTDDDIDLHVTDPEGREFNWAAPTHGGSQARLEEDNIRGPGNEIWLHPNVTPGIYRVDYVFYSGINRSVPVRGAALHRDGRSELPAVTLNRQGQRVTVAQVEVASDGSVRVR